MAVANDGETSIRDGRDRLSKQSSSRFYQHRVIFDLA